jgi:putative transposase
MVNSFHAASDNQRYSEDRVGFLRGRAGPATPLVCRFIADHQGRRDGPDGLRWGIQSICAGLVELGVQIAPSTYYAAVRRPPSARAQRVTELMAAIRRAWDEHRQVSVPTKCGRC